MKPMLMLFKNVLVCYLCSIVRAIVLLTSALESGDANKVRMPLQMVRTFGAQTGMPESD